MPPFEDGKRLPLPDRRHNQATASAPRQSDDGRHSTAPVAFADYRPMVLKRPRPSPVAIRRATRSDLRELATVATRVRGGDMGRWQERLEEALVGEDRLILLAESVDGLVGFGKVKFMLPQDPTDPAPAGHYLSGVMVVPEWRRMGLASELTHSRLHWAWARVDEAWYFANTSNLASVDLHSAFGFAEVARASSFLGITFKGGVGVLFRAIRPRSFN